MRSPPGVAALSYVRNCVEFLVNLRIDFGLGNVLGQFVETLLGHQVRQIKSLEVGSEDRIEELVARLNVVAPWERAYPMHSDADSTFVNSFVCMAF